MIFDMPDTPSLATGTPSASQTFGEAVKGAVEENPIGQFGEWYQRAVAANPDAFNYGTPTKVTPLTEEQYKASPHYREGVPYQKGMTDTLAEVLAHQYDDKQTQAAVASDGSFVSTLAGGLVGGALDPIYYIPFVDGMSGALKAGEVALRAHEFETLAKVAKVAGKDYAIGGKFTAGGMKQASNAALAYLAEQPAVAAENRSFGENYDLNSAATGLLQVALGGGLLGGVAHSLSVQDRITGINKAMEQLDRGEPVDVSDAVKPQPTRELVPTALRGGTIPEIQEGMPDIHKIAVGIAKKEQAGVEITPDERSLLDSVKEDGGIGYLKTKVAELSERRENVALRKKVAQMSPEERSKALLTHELTGIPNRRAWDEGERMPVIASMDADNLKKINDSMGHPKGDEALTKIAKAVQAEAAKVGGKGYHISGDEFRAEFPSEEAAARFHGKLSERLAGAKIEAGGKVHHGIGMSYGQSSSLDAAEEALRSDKASRAAQGLRTERVPQPGGLPAESAAGHGLQGEHPGVASAKISSTETGGEAGAEGYKGLRESILQVRRAPRSQQEVLRGLSQRVHAWLAQNPPAERVSTIKDELTQLRERVPETRSASAEALSALREYKEPKASPGLQKASGGGVAVPEVPPGEAPEDRVARLHAYQQQLLDLQAGSPSYKPTGVPVEPERLKAPKIDEEKLAPEDKAMLESVRQVADKLRGMGKALLAGANCYRG